MTLREFLEYREHKYDDVDRYLCNSSYIAFTEGWTLAVKDIRMVLEAHGFNLEIPLG